MAVPRRIPIDTDLKLSHREILRTVGFPNQPTDFATDRTRHIYILLIDGFEMIEFHNAGPP
jgi:hypothetical protein